MLTVTINSFSYKKNIPEDQSGNGGGFVFDCRAIENPGRYDNYKDLNGKNQEVIDFLDKVPEMKLFLDNVFNLVEISVKNYIERDFSSLMISFGCTGGQHRSVYCAEKLAKYIKNKYAVNITVNHFEQNLLNIKL